MGGLLAKLALGALWSKAKTNAIRDWQAIPPKARLWIMAIVALAILFVVHQIIAHHELKAARHAGYVQAQADDAAAAKKLDAKINALTAQIAANRRKENDQAVAHNAALAGTIELRGPGRAVCPRSTAATAQPLHAGTSDAAVDRVPDSGGQLIALPFDDTVEFAKSSDDWRAEALAWEGWYADLVKAWPKRLTTSDPPSAQK